MINGLLQIWLAARGRRFETGPDEIIFLIHSKLANWTLAPRSRRLAFICVLGSVVGLGGHGSLAGKPNIINKDSHYTRIGTFEENLSRLCGLKLFNQSAQLLYTAYFKKSKVLLGAAKGTGWNLKDPTGARRFERDYWFRSDGFTNCEVYYSVDPARKKLVEAARKARRGN